MHHLWHELVLWLGLTDASGPQYLWWSGFVGDLAIFGALFVGARHLNCHVHGCWRIGRHAVDGTPYKTCTKHHPATPEKHRRVTAEHIADAHWNANPRPRRPRSSMNA